jgi:hypothetical protein
MILIFYLLPVTNGLLNKFIHLTRDQRRLLVFNPQLLVNRSSVLRVTAGR